MASYELVKVIQNQYSLQDFLDVHENTDDMPRLSGFISGTKLMWMTCGPFLEIRDSKTGNKISDYTFGAAVKDNSTHITSVKELNTQFADSSLLIIGLECMVSSGMVCVFDVISWRILRAIQTPHKVSYISVINAGNEVSSFPGPLNNFDGALSVGMFQGDVYIVDLCRQAIDEARKITGISEIKGEIDPCQLTVLPVDNIDGIEHFKERAERESSHLAIHLNDVGNRTAYFILKGQNGDDRIHVNKEEVIVSSLHYAPQLSSLFIGYNFGALQIWNLINMNLIYTSPVYSENIPISHFAIMEPVDDPRAFCYFWAVYSNSEPNNNSFPLAALYSLSYESKDWHDGYGYIYLNLLSCAVRFQADLSMVDNKQDLALGASCVRLEAFSKGLNRNIANSVNEYTEDSYTFCELVWNIVCKGNIVHTYLSIFDLNQWYKEQMPNAPHYQQCKTYMSIVCISDLIYKNNCDNFPLMDVHINASSIRPFVGAQRLEEHYYPASLSFDGCCVSELEIYLFKNHGLQKQLYRNLETAGPLALMKPTELYQSSISLGLTPLFMDTFITTNLVNQRDHLLSVALENRMESWLCKCATSWGNGSHRAAGLSLDLFLNWAWQRANTLKNNADKLCVPLFDQAGTKLDANSSNVLSKCRNQIFVLKKVYRFICNKCTQFLVNPDITKEQSECLTRVFTYLDVLGWLINVGLLPEFSLRMRPPILDEVKLQLPYNIDSLKSYYHDRRANLNILIKSNDVYRSNFMLYIDKITNLAGESLEREWKCDGGSGQYPPSSIQALLRTYLIENIDMQLKHTIVTYLLLDLAMTLNEEQYKTILPTLIKFPNIFKMSTSITKIIQGFWQLDHGELETATENLCDPMIKSSDLQCWQHKYIIESLLLQNQEKMALLYMKVRQLPQISIDDIILNISLLVNNKMLTEAFELQRKHFGKTELLDIIFNECLKTNQLNDLIDLNLSRNEEEALFAFMKDNSYRDEINFKSVYYIQRSRMYDFYESQYQNRDRKIDLNVGKCITETLSDYMSKIDKKILNTCMSHKAKLFSTEKTTAPMSVFLHNKKEHIKYKSDLLIASITKARETWFSHNEREEMLGPISKVTDDDFPFVRPPLFLASRKRMASDLIYPKIVESLPKEVSPEMPTPTKKNKVSPRESVHTPVNDSCEMKRLTKIDTPIIVKKLNLINQLNASNITTPQSILKVKTTMRCSKSPVDRGNSTTPENLDEIEDVEDDDMSFVHSTKIFENISARSNRNISSRKSLLKSHVVRFSGINKSSSLTMSSYESKLNSSDEISNTILNINRLPAEYNDTINTVTENKSTSLSTDNDTFYSPEASIEENDYNVKASIDKVLTIQDIFLKREKNPIPGSPKSRRSYKGDILDRPLVRSSTHCENSESAVESSPLPNVEILSPESNLKSKKRVSARKSLSRLVLENNAITKMRATSSAEIDVTSIVDRTITVETVFSNTEVVKKVVGKVVEEIIDKYESKNSQITNIQANIENVKQVSHEESNKTITRIQEDEITVDGFTSSYSQDVFKEEVMDVDEIGEEVIIQDNDIYEDRRDDASNSLNKTEVDAKSYDILNTGNIVEIDSSNSCNSLVRKGQMNFTTDDSVNNAHIFVDEDSPEIISLDSDYNDDSNTNDSNKDYAIIETASSNENMYDDVNSEIIFDKHKDSSHDNKKSMSSSDESEILILQVSNTSSMNNDDDTDFLVDAEENKSLVNKISQTQINKEATNSKHDLNGKSQSSFLKAYSCVKESKDNIKHTKELLDANESDDMVSPNESKQQMTDMFDKTQCVAKTNIELNMTDELEKLNDSYIAPILMYNDDPFENSKLGDLTSLDNKEDITSMEVASECKSEIDTKTAKKRKSSSIKSSEATSPVRTRRQSFRESGSTAPTIDTPTRVLRSRRSSTSTESPSIKLPTINKPATRTRSASVDVDVTTPKRRSLRAKSVDNLEKPPITPKTRARRASTVLPAITEEKKSHRINAYSTNRRLTRHQKDVLEKNLCKDSKNQDLDLVKINPIELMDKEEFEGEPDPEEDILQISPDSSITYSNIETVRNKKPTLTLRKRKTKAATDDSPPKVLRRGRSASVDINDESVPLTPTRRTRKASQDSIASDVSTELRRSTRRRTKSEISDSDGESTTTTTGVKKTIKLKNALCKINEEGSQDTEKEKPKRGRKKAAATEE